MRQAVRRGQRAAAEIADGGDDHRADFVIVRHNKDRFGLTVGRLGVFRPLRRRRSLAQRNGRTSFFAMPLQKIRPDHGGMERAQRMV